MMRIRKKAYFAEIDEAAPSKRVLRVVAKFGVIFKSFKGISSKL